MPPNVVNRPNTEVNKILATPAFRERVAALGAEPATMSPTAFGAKAEDDTQRFGRLIRKRNIRGD